MKKLEIVRRRRRRSVINKRRKDVELSLSQLRTTFQLATRRCCLNLSLQIKVFYCSWQEFQILLHPFFSLQHFFALLLPIFIFPLPH